LLIFIVLAYFYLIFLRNSFIL